MKLIYILLIIIMICGCGSKDRQPAKKDEGKAKPEQKEAGKQVSAQVLLAYEKTRFKQGLIDKMKELLEKESISVQIIEHSDKGFDVKDPSLYKAIFITCSGVHSKIRPWIKEWLDKNKAQKDKVLLHVTQNSDWKLAADVDSVTSASSMSDIDKLAADFIRRVKGLMGKPKTGEKAADAK
jgi:hypothetical protein